MIWIGIRGLKTHLSEYVHEVKRGEQIVITDRGRPVARMIGDVAPRQGIRRLLVQLSENGSLDLPKKPIKDHRGLPAVAKGRRASELILEGRR